MTTQAVGARVYLYVPYRQKEEAKKCKARWCPERRQWWINKADIAANPGVHRWMNPDTRLAVMAREAHDFVSKASRRKAGRRDRSPPKSTPRTDFSHPTCVCEVPPWEHCEHTRPEAARNESSA